MSSKKAVSVNGPPGGGPSPTTDREPATGLAVEADIWLREGRISATRRKRAANRTVKRRLGQPAGVSTGSGAPQRLARIGEGVEIDVCPGGDQAAARH
jgi:predicted pyridoxine 5'-phosphate oxidase superfamily flavin-nucleotide-binding protein